MLIAGNISSVLEKIMFFMLIRMLRMKITEINQEGSENLLKSPSVVSRIFLDHGQNHAIITKKTARNPDSMSS